jgi:citrate lyase gamma subunit
MAISEDDRHQMYSKLEEVFGAHVANTMMEHLPPVGWADVATKHDLDALSALFEARLDAGLARVSAEISERLRTQTLVLCTTLIAGMGVVAAIARV